MQATEARTLFDRNAASYAWINTVLSLGLDHRWRTWAAEAAVTGPHARALDAMTGTGEVAVMMALRGASVTAVDVSPGMLAQAHARARQAGAGVSTIVADVADPGADIGTDYDAVCLSFGLRYADDPPAVLKALARRLRPEGRLVVLEFCTPDSRLLSRLAAVYFFRLLPAIGGLLGPDQSLYDVLRSSTMAIGSAERVAGLLVSAGLTVTQRRRMGFGLVTGLVASRPR